MRERLAPLPRTAHLAAGCFSSHQNQEHEGGKPVPERDVEAFTLDHRTHGPKQESRAEEDEEEYNNDG
ncbi:MAG: hypothetical protein CMB99_00495 [Flavobacteriaceae bacterium]|nr:hypothetical protein [Flavobacteriaceae bacterium]